MSAPSAYGKPSADLVDSSARAGDVVHFSITGATEGVNYEVNVDDHWVLDGTGRGHVVTGAFTVPDLGQAARSVDVEIVISGPGKTRTVERELGYLGRAGAGSGPPVTVIPGPVVPGPAPQIAPPSPPAPVQSSVQSLVQGGVAAPGASSPSGAPRPIAKRHVERAPRHAASRVEHRGAVHRAHRRHSAGRHRSKHAGAGAHRPRHPARRIVCPCRFGHAGTTHATKAGGHVARSSPEATIPAPPVKTVRVSGGGLSAAAFVPALAALAALALGTTAIARRRRLASRLSR